MLMNNFFTVVNHETGQGSLKALIEINKGHEILKGHFPGQPVVPGVCMMQIVKELMEMRPNKKLRLNEADIMKFLAVIDPDQHSLIDVAVSFSEQADALVINASMFSGDVVFFKLKAVLKAE